MMKFLLLVLPTVTAVAVSHGLQLTYFTGERCSGTKVGLNSVGDPDSLISGRTCSQNPAMSELIRSVRVDGLEDNDKWWWSKHDRLLRFYSSEDCKNSCRERTVLETATWDECVDLSDDVIAGRTLKSFNVLVEGETGHGRDTFESAFCFLQHGDTMHVRGRHFKMQQVSSGLFREVPVEDWDNEVHLRNTTERFAEHGDVDAHGKYKFWQSAPGRLRKISLEEWDEVAHAAVTDAWESAKKRYRWMLEDICDEVPETQIDADGMIAITDDFRMSCGDYKKTLQKENEYDIGYEDWEL